MLVLPLRRLLLLMLAGEIDCKHLASLLKSYLLPSAGHRFCNVCLLPPAAAGWRAAIGERFCLPSMSHASVQRGFSDRGFCGSNAF